MTERFKARLFLTNSERESLLHLSDTLMSQDVDTMEEWDQLQKWSDILVKLVLGKGEDFYPVVIVEEE
jgi:hypothetical protein